MAKTPAQKQIEVLYTKGTMTGAEIAAEVGKSQRYVWKVVDQFDLKREHPGAPPRKGERKAPAPKPKPAALAPPPGEDEATLNLPVPEGVSSLVLAALKEACFIDGDRIRGLRPRHDKAGDLVPYSETVKRINWLLSHDVPLYKASPLTWAALETECRVKDREVLEIYPQQKRNDWVHPADIAMRLVKLLIQDEALSGESRFAPPLLFREKPELWRDAGDEYLFYYARAAPGKERWGYLKKAMEYFYKDAFVWNPIVEDLGLAFCTERRVAISSSTRQGKSWSMGAFYVLDWLAAPMQTNTFLGSTKVVLARRRVFKSVRFYWDRIQEEFPETWGTLGKIKEEPYGLYSTAPGASTGIFAMALDSDDKLDDQSGQHADRVRLGVDESQGCPNSVLSYEVNLGGAPDYQESHWGNFGVEDDPLGVVMEPERGYAWWRNRVARLNKVRPYKAETWRGKTGFYCIWLDGLASPAIEQPELEQFLLGMRRIEEIRKSQGEDSFLWRKMVRGAPMGKGSIARVISEEEQERWQCRDKPVWRDGWKEYAGYDPSRGLKDPAALCFLRYGKGTDGRWMVAVADLVKLLVPMSVQDKDGWLAERVAEEMDRRGLTKDDLTLEGGGHQNAFFWTLERSWNAAGRMHDFDPGAKLPHTIRVNGDGRWRARDYYAGATDYLWMNLREFARAGQLRGITEEMQEELAARKIVPGAMPVLLQAKQKHGWRGKGKGAFPNQPIVTAEEEEVTFRTLRTELGRSPDATDAAALGVHGLRVRRGVHPGGQATEEGMGARGRGGDPWVRTRRERRFFRRFP